MQPFTSNGDVSIWVKITQWKRKAAVYPLYTKAINVLFILIHGMKSFNLSCPLVLSHPPFPASFPRVLLTYWNHLYHLLFIFILFYIGSLTWVIDLNQYFLTLSYVINPSFLLVDNSFLLDDNFWRCKPLFAKSLIMHDLRPNADTKNTLTLK